MYCLPIHSLPPPSPKPDRSRVTLLDSHESKSPGLSEPVQASIFLQTAAYLLDVHALKFAEMSLAHELTSPSGGETPLYQVALARLHMHRHMYKEAKAVLREAVKVDILNSNAWALLGHAHYLMGEYVEGADAYERTLGYMTQPAHVHLVYIRLANIYLEQKKVSALH